MGQPRPLFHLFSSFFNQISQFLQQINVNKCPYSIRCRDSNSRPLKHESPPITTRPRLPPGNKSLTRRWKFNVRMTMRMTTATAAAVTFALLSNFHKILNPFKAQLVFFFNLIMLNQTFFLSLSLSLSLSVSP